jgi:hypothetical protein
VISFSSAGPETDPVEFPAAVEVELDVAAGGYSQLIRVPSGGSGEAYVTITAEGDCEQADDTPITPVVLPSPSNPCN